MNIAPAVQLGDAGDIMGLAMPLLAKADHGLLPLMPPLRLDPAIVLIVSPMYIINFDNLWLLPN